MNFGENHFDKSLFRNVSLKATQSRTGLPISAGIKGWRSLTLPGHYDILKDMNMRMPERRRQANYIIIALTVLIYAVFYIHDGAVLGVDTAGYQNMVLSREPGYSLLIRLFLVIFGERYFAQALVFCQMFLACAATCLLTFTIERIWELEGFSIGIVWGIQAVFLLLCRFGSGLAAIYPSTVLTEGVTYPLYFLFFKAILQLNQEMSKKRLAEIIIYGILMMLVRSQLVVTFLGLMAFCFLKAAFKQIAWKKWLFIIGSCLVSILFVICMDKLYTRILYGVPIGVVGNNSFFFVSGMYGAQETDIELFENEEERTIFAEIYEICQAEGLNVQYAGDGFLADFEHYTECFDNIKFTVAQAYLWQYYEKQGIEDPIELEIMTDAMFKKMGMPLFWDNIAVKMKVSAQDIIVGMMRTVAKASSILIPYVILAYGCFGFLLIGLFCRQKSCITAWAGLFVLEMLIGNILAISLFIYAEPRYLLYNMVPFYIMGYLMLREMILNKKGVWTDDGSIVSGHME